MGSKMCQKFNKNPRNENILNKKIQQGKRTSFLFLMNFFNCPSVVTNEGN